VKVNKQIKKRQGEHADTCTFTGSARMRNTLGGKNGLMGLPIDIPN
jgi:hypothetical protein